MNKELSFTTILLGLVIGVVMTAANVYLGLYAGMTVSASIPAAVLAMAFFSILGKKSILGANIVQTMASAGESLAAGVIFTLPALVIVGAWSDFDFWTTTLVAMSGGLLGIIFMIPLRKALIEEEKDLTYPEGVACSEVLKVSAEGAKGGASSIFTGLLLGGAFKFLASGLKVFTGHFEKAKLIGGKAWFFGLDVSPALLAVGYIVNINVAILVLIGGLIGFTIAIPLLGVPAGLENLSALDLSWKLWSSEVRYLGVGAMIVGGIWSIFSVRSGIKSGLSGLKSTYKNDSAAKAQKDMGFMPMTFFLLFSLIIMFVIYSGIIQNLGITILTIALMTICSFLFVAVSSYIVGLVGSSNNPVSGMTISALLLCSALFLALGYTGENAILCTLGVAAVVCCAACTAGDCSQDLKTGSIIGAKPASQQWAQVLGVIVPAFVIAPVLSLLHETQGIGVGLKAPQATLFASITQAIFGEGSVPFDMVAMGAALGVIILVIDQVFLNGKSFRLHLMPIAVGIYLPVTLAVPIFFGGLIRYIVERKRGQTNESQDHGVLLGSGLIAGEALMGVGLALVTYFGISLDYFSISYGVKEVLSLCAFGFLMSYLYKKARQH